MKKQRGSQLWQCQLCLGNTGMAPTLRYKHRLQLRDCLRNQYWLPSCPLEIIVLVQPISERTKPCLAHNVVQVDERISHSNRSLMQRVFRLLSLDLSVCGPATLLVRTYLGPPYNKTSYNKACTNGHDAVAFACLTV